MADSDDNDNLKSVPTTMQEQEAQEKTTDNTLKTDLNNNNNNNDNNNNNNNSNDSTTASADIMLSAVNSKDMYESLKGRIIATHKLMKYLETTRAETETEKQRIDSLSKQLKDRTAENATLSQQLKAEKSMVTQLKRRLEDTSRTTTLQQDLKRTTEDNNHMKSLLSSREMYIKQLEAQVDDLDSKIKTHSGTDQKKRDDQSMALEKKEKQIKDLRLELSKIRKSLESVEEDKMEMSITNEMLQRDYEEVKEQLETLQKQQQANIKTVPLEELESARRKLQESYTRIEQLTSEVERLEQSSQVARVPVNDNQSYAGLLSEFKKCLAENEIMKKEKRVLQDKLTELLVINEDVKDARRKSMLSHYGIGTTTPSAQNHYLDLESTFDTEMDFEEIDYAPTPSSPSRVRVPAPQQLHSATPAPQHHVKTFETHRPSRRQKSPALECSQTPNLGKRSAENESRIIYGNNGLVVPESRLDRSSPSSIAASTRKAKMTKLEKLVGARRPATFGTSPSSMKKQSANTKKAPRNLSFSDSSSTSSSASGSTSSSSSTDSDSDVDILPPLSELAQGKQQILPSSVTNPVAFAKDTADKFLRKLPKLSIKLMDRMEDYMGKHLDIFLASVETIYQGLRSHGVPVSKQDAKVQEALNNHYGVSGQIELDHCPRYIDAREKNMIWALWGLASLYPKEDPYSKIATWASENALRFMVQKKVYLACRYVRLLVIFCRNADDRQRLSVFCYDLVRWVPRQVNLMIPIVNIALLWSDLLDLGEQSQAVAGTYMIINTIQRTCAHYCNDKKTPQNIKCLNDYMVQLVHWPDLNKTQPLKDYIQELKQVLTLPDIKLIHDNNREAFDDLRLNLMKALELAYWRLDDWKATYDDFILKELWQLMADEILSNVSLELMGLLARCGLSSENSESGINLLRDTFKQILDVGNNCVDEEFPLQVTAAKCIIIVSNDDITNIIPVFEWFDGLKSTFKEKIPEDMIIGIGKLRRCLAL